jgi:hypothetical protein
MTGWASPDVERALDDPLAHHVRNLALSHSGELTTGRLNCVADDAVRREPVSDPNSLLAGKMQGIFANLAYFVVREPRQPAEFAADFVQIPYSSEQGIFACSSGWSREFESR